MSEDLVTVAAEMRSTGATWTEILGQLQAHGASRLDLVRAVRNVDGLGVGEATKIVNESGVVPSAEFEVTVDENDPFYDQLFTDEYEGRSDDDR